MAENKTLWQKTKRQSKAGFDKLWGYADKAGAPVNRLSNKLGAEAFWPTTLDKESDKAARILKSFCKDGFYQEEQVQPQEGPKQKQRVVKKIPTHVIRDCKGLAIFTTMRTGLWFSGAGGSGILVAHKEDGTWSPPAGIMLHTAGLGFLIGVDIYDCVLVLNTEQAVNAFSKWRATIGGEMSAVAGPVGAGGIIDSEIHARQAPIFTYLKSRGFYAGVQVDGTVVVERTDENSRFYGYEGSKVPTSDILSGKVAVPEEKLRMLWATLKAAQGDTNVDESALPLGPPPADYEVVEDGHIFGIPDSEDPDPYGVFALEKEGYHIKDANTKKQVPEEEFEFRPSLGSPVYLKYNRRSFDGSNSPRSSWRKSNLSSLERRSSTGLDKPTYVTSDVSTQTDFDALPSPNEDDEVDRTEQEIKDDHSEANHATERTIVMEDNEDNEGHHLANNVKNKDEDAEFAETESLRSVDIDDKQEFSDAHEDPHRQPKSPTEDDDEKPVVHVVHQAAKPQTVIRPRLVEVPKRTPPALPPRNPIRSRSDAPQGDQEIPESSTEGTQTVETKDQGTGTSIPSSPEKENHSYQSTSSHEERPESRTSPASSTKATSINERKAETAYDGAQEAEAVSQSDIVTNEKDKFNSYGTPTIEEPHKVEESMPNPSLPEEPKSNGLQPSQSSVKPQISMSNIRAGLDSDEDEDEDNQKSH